MIHVTEDIAIDEDEISEYFIRSSGPGGQKTNKASTAVQLRFNVKSSLSLPDDIRERLTILAGRRITKDGVLVIDSRRFRTQAQNRRDATQRLVELVRKAAERPNIRRRTGAPRASKERRLYAKRLRSGIKRMRRSVRNIEE